MVSPVEVTSATFLACTWLRKYVYETVVRASGPNSSEETIQFTASSTMASHQKRRHDGRDVWSPLGASPWAPSTRQGGGRSSCRPKGRPVTLSRSLSAAVLGVPLFRVPVSASAIPRLLSLASSLQVTPVRPAAPSEDRPVLTGDGAAMRPPRRSSTSGPGVAP